MKMYFAGACLTERRLSKFWDKVMKIYLATWIFEISQSRALTKAGNSRRL